MRELGLFSTSSWHPQLKRGGSCSAPVAHICGAFFFIAITVSTILAGCAVGLTTSGGSSSSTGGGGSGGEGMGGEMMICEPGSTISCYTGPVGTLGVGVCKGGAQTCNGRGTGFGLCEGEVAPVVEACGTPEDDDCDGTALDEDAGCACLPDALFPCYSGPAGTENIGICKAGVAACDATGTSFGACMGEIVPVAEDCMTPEDDDCDGVALSCGGEEAWARRFGDSASQVAKGLAIRPDGTSLLTGYMYGTADFGAGPLSSPGGSDVFLAEFDALGEAVWARRFGDGGNQAGRAVAVDAMGAAAITGYFSGTVDFGGGALNGAGSNDIFLAKLDSAGNHAWSKSFGNNSNQYGNAVAFAPNNDVVIAGHMGGSVDFGGGTLVSAGGADAFVARFGADGTPKWGKLFGDGNDQYAYGVAVQPAGNIILAGNFRGQIGFLNVQLSTAGLNDIYLASLDATGNGVWAKRFGDGAEQFAYAVAVDPSNGNIAITGSFEGSVDFGGGVLTSAGGGDIYVAVFTASGAHVFSKQFGDAAQQAGSAVTFDAQGSTIMTGSFEEAGASRVFVSKIDSGGVISWSKKFGIGGGQSGLAIGADDSNHVFLAGSFTGSLDFGGGSLSSAGAEDIFFAQLLP